MRHTLVIALVALFTLSACKTTVPVRDFPYNAIPMAQSQNHSDKDIEKAIIKACLQLVWQCAAKSEWVVAAVLNIRTHQLTVDINYTPSQFSVEYVDSVNLRYDGKKIHRQYVNWVNNLIRHIQAELVV